MKQALSRILTYLAITIALMAIFNAWPSVSEYAPLSNRIAAYAGGIIAITAIIAAIGETLRVIRNRRRTDTQYPDAPETQPLPDAAILPVDRATKPIDKQS